MIDSLSRLGSRKLSGLVLTLLALLAVLGVYVVASLFVDVSEVVVTAITTSITSIGGGHQAAQMMADRSPNYPSPTQYAGVPPAPYATPPAPGSQPYAGEAPRV